ncbi:uncharacterized protein LOC133316243 [Gastrolobium bilobum]|uniref:uncharacterized protein LOC133316243 n=1 Tax=Gastrolobium bilobum TaxID=150636 RepID=UPI002AB0946A|nr:uncharacterized protein LOC133316243 [Gastrolobium bilobum]
MTQKTNLFKGQAKKKSIPPDRHGKVPLTHKGKRFVKPSKVTKDMDADRIKWYPYQLDPNSPKEGIDKRDYYKRKF